MILSWASREHLDPDPSCIPLPGFIPSLPRSTAGIPNEHLVSSFMTIPLGHSFGLGLSSLWMWSSTFFPHVFFCYCWLSYFVACCGLLHPLSGHFPPYLGLWARFFPPMWKHIGLLNLWTLLFELRALFHFGAPFLDFFHVFIFPSSSSSVNLFSSYFPPNPPPHTHTIWISGLPPSLQVHISLLLGPVNTYWCLVMIEEWIQQI